MDNTLASACDIRTGKLDSNHAVAGGKYPFYTCAEKPDQIDTFAYEANAILVAGNNANGNFHVNRYSGKFNAYQRTYILTAKDGYSTDYIFYRLKLELKRLKERAQGSQTKFLTMPILNGMHIGDLTKSKQIKIANVLKSFDDKIGINNRINAELEAMAKTLYDYWFVQFDFPDKNGKPYKSSGGKMVYNAKLKREIPESWDIGIAADMIDFNPATVLKAGTVAPYIDMNSLPTRGFMTQQPKLKKLSGGAKFCGGDVVIARITPCLENGKTALITWLGNTDVGFGSTEFIVLRGRTMSLSCFCCSLARSAPFRQFAISNMTGTSGRKRIDGKILSTYSMALPPKTLLEKYECIMTSSFQRMGTGAKENARLSQLRDWLLPMLMNGQVTVT